MDFEKLKTEMNNHALKDYPRECVGIITKTFEYIPCKNLSDTPTKTFFLDPSALVKYDTNIWGIFHSHPGSEHPIPSSEDKVSAAFQQYKFIVGFNNKFFIYWYEQKIDALKFEPWRVDHCVNNN